MTTIRVRFVNEKGANKNIVGRTWLLVRVLPATPVGLRVLRFWGFCGLDDLRSDRGRGDIG